ncbi:Bbox zinc finger domain containing protein [Oopsacas minuta]|uniref:Bbox zinc finger domain containing protein n=1 Tax=Oopsacas minuta TaxID=111878 RepID=A0AAV7JYR2_9METZ|nr:Bbox zinc finger domain containing protein [Oopsacas minuta]
MASINKEGYPLILQDIYTARERVTDEFNVLSEKIQERKDLLLNRLQELEDEIMLAVSNKITKINGFERTKYIALDSETIENHRTIKASLLKSLEDKIRDLESMSVSKYTDVKFSFDRTLIDQIDNFGKIILTPRNVTPYRVINSDPQTIGKLEPHALATDPKDGRIFLLNLVQGKEIKVFDSQFRLDKTYSIQKSGSLSLGGITVDPLYIYVSICNKHIVYKFDKATGVLVEHLGTRGAGTLEFEYPAGLKCHEAYLLVCDSGNNRVQVLKKNIPVTFSHFIGYADNSPGPLRKPRSIDTNTSGQVVVLHTGTPCINVYTVMGELLYLTGIQNDPNELLGGFGITINEEGVIMVTDYANNKVIMYDSPDSSICLNFGSEGIAPGHFNKLHGIYASEKFLYVCDKDNQRVQCYMMEKVNALLDFSNDN